VTWADALSPLRERSFAWYFGSRLGDTLATMMASIALAFAVLEVTDSATALGQVLAAHSIPLVLFMLFGGVVADRVPRALVLQVSNLGAALSQGALAFLVLTGEAELWMFLVLAAVNGTADSIGFPAMAGMVPQLVPREQLQRANALISMSRGMLTIVAPSVAALLVVAMSPGWALAVTSTAWLLSAALLAGVRIPPRPSRAEQTSTWHDLREGWTLFRGTTWLWVVVLTFGFLNAIHAGAWSTLGPVVAKDTIGVQGWGLVVSASSAGLLLMTLVLLRVRLVRPLLLGMLGCAVMGLPLVILGASPSLLPLLVASFLAGAGIEVFGMGWNLAMQENIDDDMLARAYSYDALGSFVAIPVGRLAVGPLVVAFGYHDVLVWSGIAYAAIALLALTSRSVRTLDRVPGEAPAAEPTAR
jgi:MFS family permease